MAGPAADHALLCWMRADCPGCFDAMAAMADVDENREASDAMGWPSPAHPDRERRARSIPDRMKRYDISVWLYGLMARHSEYTPGWDSQVVGVDRVCFEGAAPDGVCQSVSWPQEHLPDDAKFGYPVVTLPLLAAPEAWPHFFDIETMLALDPADPARWWCYDGPLPDWAATRLDTRLLILGGEAAFDALAGREGATGAPPASEVRLFRHPLDWLRCGGLWAPDGGTPGGRAPGLCVLDWRPDWVRETIQAAPCAFVCDDRDHAAEIHKITRKRPKLPEIRVRVGDEQAGEGG